MATKMATKMASPKSSEIECKQEEKEKELPIEQNSTMSLLCPSDCDEVLSNKSCEIDRVEYVTPPKLLKGSFDVSDIEGQLCSMSADAPGDGKYTTHHDKLLSHLVKTLFDFKEKEDINGALSILERVLINERKKYKDQDQDLDCCGMSCVPEHKHMLFDPIKLPQKNVTGGKNKSPKYNTGNSNPGRAYWGHEMKITVPGTKIAYTFCGHSRAALSTAFYITELGIMLDCGAQRTGKVENVFITHTHHDHDNALPDMFMNDDNVDMKAYVPADRKDAVDAYIGAAFEKTKHVKNPKDLRKIRNAVIGVTGASKKNPYEEHKFELVMKKTDYIIDVVSCFHHVTSYGYGFNMKTKRLKQEYAKLPQHEIDAISKALKASGGSVSEVAVTPLFIFLGDTDERVLGNRVLDKYKLIIIECTYLENTPKELKKAKKNGHMHWNHLEKYIAMRPDAKFVLIHFSESYSDAQIMNHFAKYKDKYPNVEPWVKPL